MNNQYMYEQLKELFRAELKPIADDAAEIKKEVLTIKDTIYGNGKAGIVEEVRGIKRKVAVFTAGLTIIFVFGIDIAKQFFKEMLSK